MQHRAHRRLLKLILRLLVLKWKTLNEGLNPTHSATHVPSAIISLAYEVLQAQTPFPQFPNDQVSQCAACCVPSIGQNHRKSTKLIPASRSKAIVYFFLGWLNYFVGWIGVFAYMLRAPLMAWTDKRLGDVHRSARKQGDADGSHADYVWQIIELIFNVSPIYCFLRGQGSRFLYMYRILCRQ